MASHDAIMTYNELYIAMEVLLRGNSNFLNCVNIPTQYILSRARGGTPLIHSIKSVVRSGYIWTEFLVLHHHELEISGQAPLKLIYFKGRYKKSG